MKRYLPLIAFCIANLCIASQEQEWEEQLLAFAKMGGFHNLDDAAVIIY